MAIHPSGKLCLAVYKSSHLALWNLTKGKNKLKKKVRSDTIGLKWDLQGLHYLILCERSIAVFSITQDKPINIIKFDEKVVDFAFIPKNVVQFVNQNEGKSEVNHPHHEEADDVKFIN